MKKSIANSQHYKWGNNCEAWYLLKSDQLCVIQELMPAGTFESLHYHSLSQQVFYILSGEATFELDQELLTLEPFESIHVPSNTKHRILNNSNAELKFLVISQPKSHADRTDV